jgi:hypothetical protein
MHCEMHVRIKEEATFKMPTRLSAMHGSLVTSSLIRETTENESANAGYKFGQEEETYVRFD